MKLYAGGEHGLGRFRCPAGRGNCKQYAATVDSFFQDVRLPLHKAIKLMYCFTSDFSYEVTATEVSDVGEDQEVLSTDTIAAWFRYCREMIVDHVCKMQAGKPKLGGIDEGGSAIVVQIDEAKFGKRKYNRGRIIDGHWVLGMVDTSTNDCRMVVVHDREAATLIPLIKENVAAGSEIHTDSFRSYMGLAAEGFTHKMRLMELIRNKSKLTGDRQRIGSAEEAASTTKSLPIACLSICGENSVNLTQFILWIP
ncbi:uncharacterized protein LOC114882236 [Osmia bicornis bicornis]|uniref:uncharacterized protein LOC114882236 n=1 Tax=Osmia bicornis bicornis TaxID=1437191 RepID=UPI001EAF6D0B|nr:uncharacterized protein LOC114882236 [Osmia bicornis bicornis]